jgi:PKD repeat protein
VKRTGRSAAWLAALGIVVAVFLFGGFGAVGLAQLPPDVLFLLEQIPPFSAYPLSGSAPLTVQFEAPPLDFIDGIPDPYPDGLLYSWDFGDGSGMEAFRPSHSVQHVYSDAGTYTVKLSIRFDVLADDFPPSILAACPFIWTQTWEDCIRVTSSTSAGHSGTATAEPIIAVLYWANWNDDTIRMAEIRGDTTFIPPAMIAAEAPDVSGPTGLDVSEGWICWANLNDNTIRLMEVGAPPFSSTIIADAATAQVNQPYGLQIVDQTLYWANQGDNTIRRLTVGQKGKVISTVVADAATSHVSAPVGLHIVGDFLYWANAGDRTIRRCWLGGGNASFPVTSIIIAGPAVSGVNGPGDVHVDGSYLYWSNLGDNTIRRCSLTGGFPASSTVVANAQSGVNVPTGVSAGGGAVGWANGGDNTLRFCIAGAGLCQAVIVGNRHATGVDGPGFVRLELPD